MAVPGLTFQASNAAFQAVPAGENTGCGGKLSRLKCHVRLETRSEQGPLPTSGIHRRHSCPFPGYPRGIEVCPDKRQGLGAHSTQAPGCVGSARGGLRFSRIPCQGGFYLREPVAYCSARIAEGDTPRAAWIEHWGLGPAHSACSFPTLQTSVSLCAQ